MIYLSQYWYLAAFIAGVVAGGCCCLGLNSALGRS